jgi:hypothetical protein
VTSPTGSIGPKLSGSRGRRQGGGHAELIGPPQERQQSKGSLHRGLVWLAIGVAALYSWFAALSTPFTSRANVMTALPLIVALLATVLFGHVLRPRGTSERLASRPTGRRLWPWWAGLGVVGAWELFCYFELPRFEHPTFSSLYDSASRSQPLKAVLFFGWLALGWAIVRAYGRVRS